MGMYFEPFGMFNEDDYLLRKGRLATTSGLIGIAAALVVSSLSRFSVLGSIVFALVFFYLFTCGFWGAYNVNQWFRRYRYRMPLVLWHILRVFAVVIGAGLGIFGWGVFEHFLLLLAMGVPKLGIVGAQLILLPVVGRRFARLLKYDPYSAELPFRWRK